MTVEHEVSGDGRPVVSERQDIVYRGVSPADKKKDELAPAELGVSCRTVTPHPALLFRYSALTFNGHRIHYDRPYCIGVEGYPGLVVHGPLQATMLCQDAADRLGERPRKFSLRALSPIFDDADFTLTPSRAAKGSISGRPGPADLSPCKPELSGRRSRHSDFSDLPAIAPIETDQDQ